MCRAINGTLAALAVACLAGCGDVASYVGTIQTRPSPRASLNQGPPAHIAVVVLENHEFDQVLGEHAAPYISRLAQQYALATRYFGVSHPSLPNYLALAGGSTFGIQNDCTDCSVPGAGLAGQLRTRRISWKAYMEGLPRPCFKGALAGEYAKKHDPFVYFRALVGDQGACDHVVPLDRLSLDEQAHALPRFIWITPNLCHDAHDCSLRTADQFLERVVPPLLAQIGSNGLLFVTFDEGTSDEACCKLAAGGHVVTIAAGPGARPHARLKTPVDHYSLLQTIEDLFGLRRLGGAKCACTPSLAPMLRSG